MPNRNGGPNYRYSFQGQESDDEIKGKGNHLTTHFRGYDPRLGRWLSTDPVTHPKYSPYSAFDNNPIYFSDISGADSDPPPIDGGMLEEVEIVGAKGGSSSESTSSSIENHNEYWGQYEQRNVDLMGGNLWNGSRKGSMELAIDPNSTTTSWSDYDSKMEGFVDYYKNYRVASTWSHENGTGFYVEPRLQPLADLSITEAYDSYVKTTHGYKDHFEFEMIKWSMMQDAFSLMPAASGGVGRTSLMSPRSSSTFAPFQANLMSGDGRPRFSAPLKYNSRLDNQTDFTHSFSRSLDRTILKHGVWQQRISDRSHFFTIEGYGTKNLNGYGALKGGMGRFEIGINSRGSIYHRNFKFNK